MTDRYKDTLNLPHTDFPMKANLANREPEFLKQWEDGKLYAKLRQQRAGQKKFILHDGPPYANGHTHLGHAVNKALKDIVVKAKSLSGFDAPFVPGWDCHGLPIELNIEKKYGKAGEKLSAKEFRAACRAYAQEQIDIQRSEFKRLGVMADWENPYVTMDFSFEANIIRALGKIIANGHLQQGFKPVHWCIDCGSALAEAEVEYANKTSSAIDVRFRVVNENEFLQPFEFKSKNKGEGPVSIPIWTTTPWSLPANEAVALNPKLTGVLVQIKTEMGNERLLLAQELVASALARYSVENYEELATVPCVALEGFSLQHPFYDRQVPIILGEHVTTDTGTGAVHTAPAHGLDDFIVGQQYKLPLVNPVGGNGCYLPDVPLFAGEHVFKANAHLLEVLKEHHNLLCDKKIEHSYPHCWRHKIPLIFRATPQWFISMEQQGLRTKAMEQIAKTQWVPERGMARIASMVEQRPDWCISRQRFWGVPITLFIHNETDELHPKTMEILEKVAQLVEQKGIDAWDELNSADLLGEDAKHYRKVTDSLDVWFDSGVSHFCVLEKNAALQWPADLYLEGSDQHRGWFQSSLLTAVAMKETAPYKAVLTHGFTVDEKGRKMSKSLGNVIAPEKVINTSGADILRLWISSTDYRNEMALSEEILKRTSEAYRRIRNTIRFLLANIHDFDPAKDLVPFDQLLSLDRWAIARAEQLQQEIISAYDNYQFHLVYQKVQNFCIVDLGGFYLDIIKDRQYTLQKNSLARRSAQTALYHIAEAMVRWLAPILSYTAEEIWQFLPGNRAIESVFLATWYDKLTVTDTNDPLAVAYGKEGQQAYWNLIIQARDLINKEIEAARAAGTIGSALEAEVDIYCEPNSTLDKALRALKDELRFVLMTSDARVFSLAEYKGESSTVDLANNKFAIKVVSIAETKTKCARCWHRRSDVGTNAEHPEICGRCVENVDGKGEQRFYA